MVDTVDILSSDTLRHKVLIAAMLLVEREHVVVNEHRQRREVAELFTNSPSTDVLKDILGWKVHMASGRNDDVHIDVNQEHARRKGHAKY